MIDFRKCIQALSSYWSLQEEHVNRPGDYYVGGSNCYRTPDGIEVGFMYSATKKGLTITVWTSSLICFCEDQENRSACIDCFFLHNEDRSEEKFFKWKYVWSVFNEPTNLFNQL